MTSVHPSRQPYVEDESDNSLVLDLCNVPIEQEHFLPRGIAPEKASAILLQMDRKRRAAAIVVPTDDGRVRTRLRDLGEPSTLFGEGPGDRRDRLRELIYRIQEGTAEEGGLGDEEMQDSCATPALEGGDDEDEEYYTPGTPELLEARKKIAFFSLNRARTRVETQKAEAAVPLQRHIKHRRAIRERLQGYQLMGSQIAGDRPVSITRFSPDSGIVAAGNFSGSIHLLTIPNLEEVMILRGHTQRVGGISWHPFTVPTTVANLASGGGEGDVHIWSLAQDTPIATLAGHSARVVRVEYHPSGQYLASASFDTTWRLWDVQTQKELLLQEGHSREVYSIAFQGDGALVATGGLDSTGRIWDLRTGRTIMVLDGHIKEITGLAWHPDSYRVISSSGDASVKVWDVRMVRCMATIGAHKKTVSDIRFFIGEGTPGEGDMKAQGTYFTTAGFDGNVNIFSSDDWALVTSLSGHSTPVTSVDISHNNQFIISSGQDRTCKLWASVNI